MLIIITFGLMYYLITLLVTTVHDCNSVLFCFNCFLTNMEKQFLFTAFTLFIAVGTRALEVSLVVA